MPAYATRIDGWMHVVLGLPIAAGLVCMVGGAIAGRLEIAGVGLAIMVVYAVLLTLVVLPVRYTVHDHGIAIRAGRLVRVDVSWDQLISIWPSRSVAGAPALSSRRLVIKYRNGRGDDYIAISPRDHRAFLADVVGASRRHVIQDDHLGLA